MSESVLWYQKPAEDFNSALPVGNGRIGGMVYGKPENELIQLNEDSVWSGGKRNRNNPNALQGLEEVRNLIKEERITEAEEIVFKKMQGVTPSSRHYMPLGNLHIHTDLGGKRAKNYKRWLDLECASVFTEFTAGDVILRREVFVSEPDGVMVVHLTSENGAADSYAEIDGRDDYFDDNRPVKENLILF